MIDLYSWLTPNGEKIHIMLEETRLDYRAHPVNILRGAQFKPAFLKISPNNKIPAIVDAKGPGGKPISLFESGAILIYLADKTGKFLARSGPKRTAALEWLMFQMANIGPMMGQAYHFRKYAPEKIPPATPTRSSASTACWTGGSRRTAISPAPTTPSPTWRTGPGCGFTGARGSISRSSRT